MSTAAAMLVVIAFRLLMIAFPVVGDREHPLGRIAGVLLFVALMTGIVCLVLTPLAYRVRKTAPPPAITVGAVMIGIAPILVLVLLRIFQ